MRRALYPLLIALIGLAGCRSKQSICMQDPFQLMDEVFATNCLGRFDLALGDDVIWVSKDEIPSDCSSITLVGIDKYGGSYSTKQYKNDYFQAAFSGEFIITEEDEIALNPIYFSGKIRGETCLAQLARHRKKQSEIFEEYGSRTAPVKDYEIVPLKKAAQ